MTTSWLRCARHGDGRNLAEAAQAVRVLRAASQLRDFERAAQIDVEAAFFGFAVERCGAVNHRLGRADQARVFGGVQPETRIGEVAAKNGDARFERVLKLRENPGAIAGRARGARSPPAPSSRAPADSGGRRDGPSRRAAMCAPM